MGLWRGGGLSEISPPSEYCPLSLPQILCTPRRVSGTEGPIRALQGGLRSADTLETVAGSQPTLPRGSDSIGQKPAPAACSHRCPESSPTWVPWRWPWTTCRPLEVPSCVCPAAARSPESRSAPGSLGSCPTPGLRCTGRFTPSIPSWLRRPGCPEARSSRPIPRGPYPRAHRIASRRGQGQVTRLARKSWNTHLGAWTLHDLSTCTYTLCVVLEKTLTLGMKSADGVRVCTDTPASLGQAPLCQVGVGLNHISQHTSQHTGQTRPCWGQAPFPDGAGSPLSQLPGPFLPCTKQPVPLPLTFPALGSLC